MGQYYLSKAEICEALNKCLDELEGDFARGQLIESLDIMKKYPYVVDRTKKDVSDKEWEDILCEVDK